MSIVEQQLVDIEIVNNSSGNESALRLNYQGGTYHLYQAFAIPPIESLAVTVTNRVQQQWQELTLVNGDRYLIVREINYYSLWESSISTDLMIDRYTQENLNQLGLQQASLWLFQELWYRLEDSIGPRQLQSLADSLLAVTPQVNSWLDLDRLLHINPLKADKLEWTVEEFGTFDRQLYHLTQGKLGKKFGTELTINIIQTMPERLQLVLEPILNI